MRITADMVTAFEDATYITRFARTTEDAANLRQCVRDGLMVVAPVIAQQALPDYLETKSQLAYAERLLARARAALVEGRTADDIRTFLDTKEIP